MTDLLIYALLGTLVWNYWLTRKVEALQEQVDQMYRRVNG